MTNQNFQGEILGLDSNGQPQPVAVDSTGALKVAKRGITATIFPAGALAVTTNSSAVDVTGYQELDAFINVTAASGTTPNLVVKLQTQDPVSLAWLDIPGAAFTAATGATSEMKVITSGFGATVRGVATITGTTPSFTFSVSIVAK